MKRFFNFIILVLCLISLTGCDFKFEFGSNNKTEIPTVEKTPTETEVIEEKFIISFFAFGLAENPASIENVSEIPSNLPVINVEGYDFLGWYYDPVFENKVIVGDKLKTNVTLMAKLVVKSVINTETIEPTPEVTPKPTPVTGFTLSFNALGYTSNPTEVLNVIVIPSDLPVLSLTNYTFDGWYYESTFVTKALAGDEITVNTTLYAKFVPVDGDTVTPTPDTTPDVPVVDDTNKLVSSKTCTHSFVNNVCSKCSTEYDTQVYNIFASNTIIYDNDSANPYNFNISQFGKDVKVIFYEPNTDSSNDPYTDVSKTEFYSDYSYASSYEEAYFRTQHYYMSGDITDQQHLTPTGKVMSGSSAVRCTTAIYILDYNGGYLGYIPNSLNGENHVIWYGGAYISHNDLAAYLFAFGKIPVNNNYHKNSGKQSSVADWGKYGRVNYGSYSNDTTKYPYEPKLYANGNQSYIETDFGTIGNYYTGDRKQSIYNNGSSINRGAARFCFVNNKKSVDERYVFYTYNHYNDFQEYLNYENGFGVRFGYETAGNAYGTTNGTPTQYASVVLKTYKDLLNLV